MGQGHQTWYKLAKFDEGYCHTEFQNSYWNHIQENANIIS